MASNTVSYFIIIIYMLVLAVGSLAPIPIKAELISGSDKVIHFLLYIPLGFCVALVNLSPSPLINVLMVLGLGSVYGGLIEILQNFVSGRTASIYDEMANVLGVTTGIFFGILKEWRRARRERNKPLSARG
jgi:VanZ family protein